MKRTEKLTRVIVGVVGAVLAYWCSSSLVIAGTAWLATTMIASALADYCASCHPACQSAVAIVRSLHPDWDVFADIAVVRADEPDRYVVAIFYSAPNVRVTPPQYVLVALNRTLDFIELLPVVPDSPYFILGRK